MKLQQKLIFTEQQFKQNPDTMTNESVETILFQEWCDLRNAMPVSVLNEVQTEELAYTHQAIIRFLPDISCKMNCHRMIRMPDRSIKKQSFVVESYEIYQQENRFMLLKLSELKDE